jgi:two-component system response regulator AtoC
MATILVVEDEEVLGKAVKRTLDKLGHTVALADRGREAERLFAEVRPDLTLLDLRLPDATGLEVLERLRAQNPAASVVMMTAYATVEDAVRAIRLGAVDYLQKPLNMDALRHVVDRALEESQLRSVLTYYREREAPDAGVDAIRGRCAAIETLRQKLRRLCALPADTTPPTVLVTGETGTGKGLVARVLHYGGARRDRPFIEVNCAAIPEQLVESELFGHERGAFTDAKVARVGLFQAADRGTLFLDEVGCLPLAMQVKLLKAIEEKAVRPVGARSDRHVDVQIVAATNSRLDEMVAGGDFREDLYYRLRVAPLEVPPLRERGDDVMLLAETFLGELVQRYRSPVRRFAPDAEAAIRAWRWPGNIRELRNTIDRAVLFATAEAVDAAALGLPASGAVAPEGAAAAAVRVGPAGFAIELPAAGIQFEELERALLEAALRKAHGSPSGAARLLGMTRDTMRYRMEKFAIDVPSLVRSA